MQVRLLDEESSDGLSMRVGVVDGWGKRRRGGEGGMLRRRKGVEAERRTIQFMKLNYDE